MRILYIAAAAALALAACSDRTEKNAAATAENAGDTVASAASDTAAAPEATGPTMAADGQTYPAAEAGCLDEIAKVTNTDRAGLKVTEVSSAESGISVLIQVPEANGPWFCLANADGSVQGTEFRGDEGAL